VFLPQRAVSTENAWEHASGRPSPACRKKLGCRQEDRVMSTAASRVTPPPPPGVPLLENGDRMTQAEFHRRYKACPPHVRAELIGGIVYMTSPLRRPHGNYHLKLGLALELYASGTPGVEAGDNATAILGEESEPQPDLALRILPEYGGRSRLN